MHHEDPRNQSPGYYVSVFTGYSVLRTSWHIIFEGINVEGCAWFWDHVFVHMLLTHCYSSLFWQQYNK